MCAIPSCRQIRLMKFRTLLDPKSIRGIVLMPTVFVSVVVFLALMAVGASAYLAAQSATAKLAVADQENAAAKTMLTDIVSAQAYVADVQSMTQLVTADQNKADFLPLLTKINQNFEAHHHEGSADEVVILAHILLICRQRAMSAPEPTVTNAAGAKNQSTRADCCR